MDCATIEYLESVVQKLQLYRVRFVESSSLLLALAVYTDSSRGLCPLGGLAAAFPHARPGL